MSIRQVAFAAAVAALVIVPASAASALEATDPEPIAFTATTATITVGQPITATLQLGDWWSEKCVTSATGEQCPDPSSVHVTLDGRTVIEQLPIDAQTLQVALYDRAQDLSVGVHTLTAGCNAPFTCATTTPLKVTVQAASLSVDGRVETDEAHPTGAVVTALLSGDVIDQYLGCACSLDPAGSWSVSITDADGAKVFTRTIAVKAGEGKDVSAYWNDVPSGGTFTARFAFTPSGSAASKFRVGSDEITYSSPAASTPQDDATPDPSAQVATTTTTRTPSLPLWLIAAGGALVLAALIATAVLVIRLASGPVLVLPRAVLEPGDPEEQDS